MTHTRSQFLKAAVMFGLAVSSVAEAQGPVGQGPQGPRPPAGERGGPMGGGPMGGMMRGGPAGGQRDVAGPGNRGLRGPRGNPASLFLRMRRELQLTDEQVKKLEALQAAPAPKSNDSDLMRARADLMDATQGDGNLAKARVALDRMSALRNERVIAQLKLRQDARAVLTAEQKTKLDNMRSAMRRNGRAQLRSGLRAGRGGRGQGGPAMRGQPGGGPGQFGPGGMGPNRGPARGPGGGQ